MNLNNLPPVTREIYQTLLVQEQVNCFYYIVMFLVFLTLMIGAAAASRVCNSIQKEKQKEFDEIKSKLSDREKDKLEEKVAAYGFSALIWLITALVLNLIVVFYLYYAACSFWNPDLNVIYKMQNEFEKLLIKE